MAISLWMAPVMPMPVISSTAGVTPPHRAMRYFTSSCTWGEGRERLEGLA